MKTMSRLTLLGLAICMLASFMSMHIPRASAATDPDTPSSSTSPEASLPAEPTAPNEEDYMVTSDEDEPVKDTTIKLDASPPKDERTWNVPLAVAAVVVLLGVGIWLALGRLDY